MREKGYLLTEAGNAERLADRHAGRFKYCKQLGGWLRWNGSKWTAGQTGLQAAALETVRSMMAEAEAITGNDDDAREMRAELLKHALRSDTASAFGGMIRIAQDLPGFVAEAEAFDADPWVLNVKNGSLELRTGALRPHDAASMHTQVAGVAFDPAATCPRWDAFLAEMLPDAEVRAFLQRFAGYCLTGVSSERVFVVFHGRGRNGKSVIVKILYWMLGDYACYPDHSLLLATKQEKHPTMLAHLKGKRFAGMSEVDKGRSLSEAMLKRLTGDEPITAHLMHCDDMTFEMTAKLVAAVNDRLKASADSDAVWDRIREIPFTVQIPEERKDKDLSNKLRAEMPGILNWALAGLAAWQRDGLGAPPAVVAATRDYRGESDYLMRFLTERYRVKEGGWLRRSELRASFEAWARKNVPIDEATVLTRMSDRAWAGAVRSKLPTCATPRKDADGSRGWALEAVTRADDDDEAAE